MMRKFRQSLLLLTTLCSFSFTHAKDLQTPLAQIYDEVILHHSELSKNACHTLAHSLEPQQPIRQAEDIKPYFLPLMQHWKAMQTSYILGELDEDFIDTPSRIDIFHQGKEDWQAQLTRALHSQSPAKTALFKHSLRSINALEFILFQDDTITPREHDFAYHITQSLCHYFDQIDSAYRKQRSTFLAKPEHSLSYLVHSLSMSIFSTRDWRIADPLGMSRKYKDKPDLRRQEYPFSHLSTHALQSIFKTQKEILGKNNRLYAILKDYEQEALAKSINDHLEQTLTILSSPHADLEQVGKPLFAISQELYQQYYISIVAALPIVAKVLDADGD